MELIIILGCGIVFIFTAVMAYVRQTKDFNDALNRKDGGNRK